MHRLEISDKETLKTRVREEISRSAESRYGHRLHALLLLACGFGCYDVARILGQDPRTIERWVQRFERNGLAGLHEEEREGRPRRLNGERWEAMRQDLKRSPHEFGYSQDLWDGRLLTCHLHSLYGIVLGVRQCQRLLQRMDFH